MNMYYNYNNKPLTEVEKIRRCRQNTVIKDKISKTEEERLKIQFERTLKQMRKSA